MRKYFGTDGIRGVAGKTLTASLSFKVGQALGKLLTLKKDRPKVLVGRDTRISCDMIETALISGLTSTGVDVMTTGVIPTPAIAFLTKTLETDSGIMISASHNPYQDNGIKIFGADGFKLTDEQELEIEHFIDSHTREEVSFEKIGHIYSANELSGKYIQHMKQTISSNLNNMKIALDCANGATSQIAPYLFGDLDADIETIGCNPNGININDKVGSTHIESLQNFIKETENIELGFSFDGDGDRVLAVDHLGNIVDGDKIMFILAKYLKEKNELKDNMVVSTVMSNLGFYKAIEENNLKSIKTAVGDRYVVDEMRKHNYSLGGEQSGHIIMMNYSTTGDGILAAIQLAQIIKLSGKSLYDLAQEVTIFPQKLVNLKVSDKNAVINDPEVLYECKKVENELSGDGRILLRASGTENLIRVMVEAQSDELTDKYCAQVANKIREKY